VNHHLSLRTLVGDKIAGFGDRVAIVDPRGATTYAALARLRNQVGQALHAAGLSPGDRVGLCLPNGVEYVALDLAILDLGLVKVALNEMLSPSDIAHCLNDSSVAVVFTGPGLLGSVTAGAPPAATVVGVHCGATGVVPWERFLEGHPETRLAAAPAPDDLGLVIYTGGTTGRPKGVMHTQERLAINIAAHIIELELGEDERMLLMSPLPHSAGFHLQAGLAKGASIWLDSGFDPQQVLRRIADDKITFTFMVPTMIYRLLDAAEASSLDLGSLRTLVYGAAPITEDRLRQGLAVFGPVFSQLYGQSEAPNFLTRLTKGDHLVADDDGARLKSCGRAVAMSRIKVVAPDAAELREVPVGEVGEIVASSPYTMIGYLGLPEATAETIVDGWLRTGDIGRMDDDGYVYLLDRKKDMIITGGMNVYTTEVEQVVMSVPGVVTASVVGVPHPDWGEAVVAVVTIAAESDGDTVRTDVIAACRSRLAKYKVPKRVDIVAQLPLTSVGKLDKKRMRAESQPFPV